ncbi:MAG: hypothetical protein WA126_08235 [Thermodesulfovibrionales bacterium]
MKNTESIQKKIFLLTIFSIAMGFIEAVVVVYLRQIYYPEGFGFPLKEAIWGGLFLEYLREISTIVMLLTVSVLAGRMTYERFSYFLYCFGVWDIFYYVGLKALLDWPSSLLTWDVLFLIPVVWIAPILAPIVCATTIIIFSGFILYYQNKGYRVRINLLEWSLMSLGALVILITFIWDYSKIIIQGGFLKRFLSLTTDLNFQSIVTSYIPNTYHWTLFILGEFLIFCSIVIFVRRMKSIR